MPFNLLYESDLKYQAKIQKPQVLLLPRNNPELLAFMLDMFEREELQRINDELKERKRLLEEKLSELNEKLRELEELKSRLEQERNQLEVRCVSMEERRTHLQNILDTTRDERLQHQQEAEVLGVPFPELAEPDDDLSHDSQHHEDSPAYDKDDPDTL